MKFVCAGICAGLLAVGWAGAATLSWSADAPVVDEADIACFAGATNDASNVNGGGDDGTVISSERPAIGQTFRTGNNPDGYSLRAITLQHVQYASDMSGWSVDPPWTPQFEIQVGTKEGTDSFAVLTVETASMAESGHEKLDAKGGQEGTGTGWFFTFTLDEPVLLAANTEYAFSVGLQKGPYIEVSGNGVVSSNYTGGEAFGLTGQALSDYAGDYVFHLDLSTDVREAWSADPPESWTDDHLFFVTTDNGDGVAFLMEGPKGGIWMVSSSSVFQGTEHYRIANRSGTMVRVPEQVLVAKKRDLILFRTDQPSGFPLAEKCGFEEKLLTFSLCKDGGETEAIRELNEAKDSLKETVDDINEILRDYNKYVTYRERWTREELEEALEEIDEDIKEIDEEIAGYEKDKKERLEAQAAAVELDKGVLLKGTAVALGPNQIEISAPITRHDSGGPVVNRDGEVVGISSHLIERSGLPDWITEGTQFEGARRFALRLEGVEWMPMSRAEYEKQTLFVQENYDTLGVFADIMDQLNDSYFRTVRVDTDSRDIERWAESHNEMLAGSRNDQKIEEDFDDFVRMIRRLENDAARLKNVSIPFYQEQMFGLSKMYHNIYERLREIAKEL